MTFQVFGDLLGIAAVTLHAQAERLGAEQRLEGIHRRHGGAEVAQAHRMGLHREGHVAEGLLEIQAVVRSEEHTSELQSLMRNSYAVFCLKKKKEEERQQQSTHKRNRAVIKNTNSTV